MQKSGTSRPRGRPRRKSRAGAAEFARAMARAEFGRNYVDDKQLEEVQRSLAAKAPSSKKRRKTTEQEER